jgi:hypothetical protein
MILAHGGWVHSNFVRTLGCSEVVTFALVQRPRNVNQLPMVALEGAERSKGNAGL